MKAFKKILPPQGHNLHLLGPQALKKGRKIASNFKCIEGLGRDVRKFGDVFLSVSPHPAVNKNNITRHTWQRARDFLEKPGNFPELPVFPVFRNF